MRDTCADCCYADDLLEWMDSDGEHSQYTCHRFPSSEIHQSSYWCGEFKDKTLGFSVDGIDVEIYGLVEKYFLPSSELFNELCTDIIGLLKKEKKDNG